MSDLFAELPEPRFVPAFEVTVQVGPCLLYTSRCV